MLKLNYQVRSILLFFLFFSSNMFFSQTDFSDSCEDLFSYSNVKKIVKADTSIYALTDNAIFVYDEASKRN